MVLATRGATPKSESKVVGHALQALEDRKRKLIQERRQVGSDDFERRTALCKAIKKLTKEKLQKQKEEQILTILQDFRGLREISQAG